MALNQCLPLKMSSVARGGNQNDVSPTEVGTLVDALSTAGYYVQGPSVSVPDRVVFVDRTAGGNLRLTDAVTSHVLAELVSSTTGQNGSHDALRDLQHFLGDEGPGPGFASGAYLQRSFAGPLLTSEIWFTSAAQTVRIVGKTIAYQANTPLVSSITTVMYSAANAPLKTVVDTFSYTGLQCTGVTRTWS